MSTASLLVVFALAVPLFGGGGLYWRSRRRLRAFLGPLSSPKSQFQIGSREARFGRQDGEPQRGRGRSLLSPPFDVDDVPRFDGDSRSIRRGRDELPVLDF